MLSQELTVTAGTWTPDDQQVNSNRNDCFFFNWSVFYWLHKSIYFQIIISCLVLEMPCYLVSFSNIFIPFLCKICSPRLMFDTLMKLRVTSTLKNDFHLHCFIKPYRKPKCQALPRFVSTHHDKWVSSFNFTRLLRAFFFLYWTGLFFFIYLTELSDEFFMVSTLVPISTPALVPFLTFFSLMPMDFFLGKIMNIARKENQLKNSF